MRVAYGFCPYLDVSDKSLSLTVRKNNHYAHDSTASIDLVSVAVFFNDFLQIRQCSNYLSSNDAVERNVPLRGIFVG